MLDQLGGRVEASRIGHDSHVERAISDRGTHLRKGRVGDVARRCTCRRFGNAAHFAVVDVHETRPALNQRGVETRGGTAKDDDAAAFEQGFGVRRQDETGRDL